ncbi:DHA2 family efflux MFS transporter permease subunit [uncultured Nevskia sp.]|uniref:DHA2 family efflux MFS transporter permease subunit n=1 Tax=uncultured Nevskia sp. TaxID=228950 RepID=UPI0025E10332|nr:DHA2 family efflux MFS transporter permease subunit [uncultured Nevskia sp.]
MSAIALPLQHRNIRSFSISPAARAWIGFTAMLFGNFIAILDVQIVASSVNEIRAGLSASLDEIGWVQTSYLIAEVIGIPLSAFLSRAFSTRVYFAACALGFTVASLACAMAWNLPSMIVFRAIQGFLAGGLIPTTMAALFLMFPESRRATPYVLIGMVSLLAPAVGAGTGGYVTSVLSWHWLFLINLLPGVLVASIVWRCVDIDKPQPALLRSVDLPGLIGLALALGSLQFVLEEGMHRDWFDDALITGFTIVSIAGALLFAARARIAAEPIVDLRCLANRNFSVGCAISFVVGTMLYGVVFLIPTFLGHVRGYDSLQIGQITMLSGITMFLSAPLAGRLQHKLDSRWMMAWGLAMVALGNWLDASLTAGSGFDAFLLPQLVRGHGFTFCLVPATRIALGTLPDELLKSGSGLFNLMRNLGGAFGIAGIQIALRHFRSLNEQGLHASLDIARVPVQDALSAAGRIAPDAFGEVVSGQSARIAARLAGALVEREAAVIAFNNVFLLLSGLVIAALFLLLLANKPQLDPLAMSPTGASK